MAWFLATTPVHSAIWHNSTLSQNGVKGLCASHLLLCSTECFLFVHHFADKNQVLKYWEATWVVCLASMEKLLVPGECLIQGSLRRSCIDFLKPPPSLEWSIFPFPFSFGLSWLKKKCIATSLARLSVNFCNKYCCVILKTWDFWIAAFAVYCDNPKYMQLSLHVILDHVSNFLSL